MFTASPFVQLMLSAIIGILSGSAFYWIVGDLNSADYLIEQFSLGLVEIPFIILVAVIVRKNGWERGVLYTFCGVAMAVFFSMAQKSITPVIFLKASLMGLILGRPLWFSGSFAKRLTAVSIPGIAIAFLFGVPLVAYGVSPELLDSVRQDALEMYQAIMSGDEAINTADNAMQMFEGMFKVALAVLIVSNISFSWISFHGTQFIMKRFGEVPEYVASLNSFKVPFYGIWAFIAGLGLLLVEIKQLYPIAMNIFAVMVVLYLIQGIAITMYHMERISMGRIPRVLFWLVFFLTIGFTGLFLTLAGVTDNWFNLRFIPKNGNRKQTG